MADVPGVTVKTGLVNAVGRAAIGVSANGGVSWLLLDPQTYQVNGVNEKDLAIVAGVKTPPSTTSLAWAVVALVRGPGVR